MACLLNSHYNTRLHSSKPISEILYYKCYVTSLTCFLALASDHKLTNYFSRTTEPFHTCTGKEITLGSNGKGNSYGFIKDLWDTSRRIV